MHTTLLKRKTFILKINDSPTLTNSFILQVKKNGVRPKRPSDVGRTIIIVIIIIRIYMGIRRYIGRCLGLFRQQDYTFFVYYYGAT